MQTSLESLAENPAGVSGFSHIDYDYVAHTPSGKVHVSKDHTQSKFKNLYPITQTLSLDYCFGK